MRDFYRLAAPVYDWATFVWSGGGIWKSRVCQVEWFGAGERVLYAGGGRGKAAVRAASRGARVCFLERSPAMILRAKVVARVEGCLMDVDWVEEDAWEWEPDEGFRHVCANHFLNVFEVERMRVMRERLWEWVEPGGSLYVEDFRPLCGGKFGRVLQRAHHWVPLAGCRAFTRNPMHPIYDHGEWEPLGLDLVETFDHRAWGIGPAWYRTWRFVKRGLHGS